MEEVILPIISLCASVCVHVYGEERGMAKHDRSVINYSQSKDSIKKSLNSTIPWTVRVAEICGKRRK